MTSNPFLRVKTQSQRPKLELSSPSTSPLGVVPGTDSRATFSRLVPCRWLGSESKVPSSCVYDGQHPGIHALKGVTSLAPRAGRRIPSGERGGVCGKATEVPPLPEQGRAPLSGEEPRTDGVVPRGAGQVLGRGELAQPFPPGPAESRALGPNTFPSPRERCGASPAERGRSGARSHAVSCPCTWW